MRKFTVLLMRGGVEVARAGGKVLDEAGDMSSDWTAENGSPTYADRWEHSVVDGREEYRVPGDPRWARIVQEVDR